jgi:hypothetical protein
VAEQAGGKYSGDTLDKWMIHLPARIEQDDARFRHATQNNAQFKTCLFLEFSI